MSKILTLQERHQEAMKKIKCEMSRDDVIYSRSYAMECEVDELRTKLAERDAKLAALEGQKPVIAITDELIDEFLDDYEMIGENEAGQDCYYTPTKNDKALIKDAIFGFLCDAPSNLYSAAGAAPVPEGWQLVPVDWPAHRGRTGAGRLITPTAPPNLPP